MEPIPIGTRGFHLAVNDFNGEVKVHIRKYFDLYKTKLIPTKIGITLNENEFNELQQKVMIVDKKVKKVKSHLKKNKKTIETKSKKRDETKPSTSFAKKIKKEPVPEEEVIQIDSSGDDSDSDNSSKDTTILSDYSDYN